MFLDCYDNKKERVILVANLFIAFYLGQKINMLESPLEDFKQEWGISTKRISLILRSEEQMN
jgi:hypothetical protein